MKEEKIEQPNVNYEDFLNNNPNLSQLYMPNLEQIGDRIIFPDKIEGELHLPKLEENKIGHSFISPEQLKDVDLSGLRIPNQMENRIILPDKIEGELHLPKLEENKIGHSFISPEQLRNSNISKLNFGILLENSETASLALSLVGIDYNDFIYGKLGLEDMKKGLVALRKAGVDVTQFLKFYPYLLDIPLDEEQLKDVDLSELRIPNQMENRIILPDKIEGELHLLSLEESKKAHAALISVGLNAMDFFYGNLSLEDMKMGLEALKNAGVDVATFIKSYPHLEGIDLDEEPKNKTF